MYQIDQFSKHLFLHFADQFQLLEIRSGDERFELGRIQQSNRSLQISIPSLSVVSQFQLLSQKIKTKSNNKKKHSERKDKIRKPLLRDVNCDKSRPYVFDFCSSCFPYLFLVGFYNCNRFQIDFIVPCVGSSNTSQYSIVMQ